MCYNVARLEGIGPTNARRLSRAGIRTTCSLLKRCGDRRGRTQVSERTGFPPSTLLAWANLADLTRVRGIGEEYAELLHAAGVDTVSELRTRRAERLTAAMQRANERRRVVRRTPSEIEVARWIAAAKGLPAVIRP